MRSRLANVALSALVLSATGVLYAQDSSSMTGVVTDNSGAVMPGTVVTLMNTQTGLKFTAKTNSQGSYRFPNVPPQVGYTVTFSRDGFASVVVKDFPLTVGNTRTQDAKLIAGANQAIEVSGQASEVTLNTTDATIGNNIDIQLVNDLPVQSRSNPTALFFLQPGVVNTSQTSSVTNSGGNSASFAGARTDQNSVTVDGMDVNDIVAGTSLGLVGNAPVDAVQEFRGTVAGLVAGQGTGSGGQFQLVTKSGTNRFHGDLNEYHRDTATEANTWFNNNVGLPRTPITQNQFGGAIGGPIKRDKLFFFFDFNNNRIAQSVAVARTVPLPSYLAGNINYINNNAGCTSGSRLNTTPGCISTLSPTQIRALDPANTGTSAGVLAFLNQRYGTLSGGVFDPTGGDGVNTGYYRFNYPEHNILYSYTGRLDYNLTSTQHVFARFTVAHQDAVEAANEFPGDPFTSPFTDRSYGYVISHVWQLGPNKVNQFYYGDNVQEWDFANNYNPTGVNQYSFSKYTATFLSGPYLSPSSQERRVPVPEVRDDFNWQLGRHALTFGGTFKFLKTNSQLVNDFNTVTLGANAYTPVSSAYRPKNILVSTTPVYDFVGAFASSLGTVAEVDSNYNYDRNSNPTPQGQGSRRHYRFFQTELYFGDVWKVTPHLTVDYGVRYQLYSVPYEATGFESIQNTQFDSYFGARVAQSAAGKSGANAVPTIVYSPGGKANNAAPLYSPNYKDFAPRFAFSYRPGSTRTVINGSAGIVFDRSVINAVNFIQDQSSQLFQQSISSPQFNGYSDPRAGANLAFSNPNVAPAITRPYAPFIDDAAGDIAGIPNAGYGLYNNEFNTIVNPNLKDPYSINFNLGLQQELPGHMVMRLNYVGRLGRRLLAQADASQLVDYVDPVSGQSMGQAVAALETQARLHGGNAFNATPLPWFENVLGRGTAANASAYGEPNETQLVLDNFESLLVKGDFADMVQGLAGYAVLPANVGLAAQFAGNTYVTNKGFSNYNGLLFSLSKNLSSGLKFDFNYTWSHSIDNTSQPANSIASSGGYGFICDAQRPRECRANSDFDATNALNSDFVYNLPFGRQRMFGGGIPIWLDEVIGGWQVSGTPAWQSGLALTTSTTSFVAGYANNAPAIFTGNRSDVSIKVHKVGSTVLAFPTCNSTAACSNLAGSDFAYPTGFNIGQRNFLRGPSAFTMDSGLAKNFALMPNERLNLKFRADFFNVLNHPVFNSPATDISQSSGLTFGQITSTPAVGSPGGARLGQYSLRLEF